MKSHRGAPKRIPTAGFACPNQQCPYFGITDASIHALVGDGKHGHAERIQTFRGPACCITFSARRDTPLYRLKTSSQQIAMVLVSAGRRAGPCCRRASFRLPASDHYEPFCPEQPVHAHTLHERFFCHLHLPHIQLDELRTRLRRAKQILWLWLAIDPLTKILPVLYLGPRTQHLAHRVIHSLRQTLAAFLHPPFY